MGTGAKIKRYLESKGISQAYLGRQTGIAVAKLNLSLNEKRVLKLEEYRLICYALGVNADTFLAPEPPESYQSRIKNGCVPRSG